MKRFAATMMVLACGLASAQSTVPNQVRITHNNESTPSNGTRTIFIPVPASGDECLLSFYNDGTNRPDSRCRAIATVLSGYATTAALTSGLAGKFNTPSGNTAQYLRGDGSLAAFPSIPAAQVNSDWNASSGAAQILNKPTLFDGQFSSLTGKPSTLAGYGVTDAYPLTGNPSGFLTGITSGQVTAALGFTPYNATNPSGYITSAALSPYLTSATAASTYATSASVTSGLAAKQNTLSLTTTGSGAATLIGATLNIPTPVAASPFNFSQPASRTLAVSTSYQATDPSKAAIIVPSYSCQNATQVLVSSACTVQVRMGTSALTCSTGTVYYTQSLTVQLGVLITQNSINPVQINLPIGGYFIICPTAGTFTINAVEQTAGF